MSEIKLKLRQLYSDIKNAELIPAKDGDTFEDGQRRSLDRTLICLFQLICEVENIEKTNSWRKIESDADLPDKTALYLVTIQNDGGYSWATVGFYSKYWLDVYGDAFDHDEKIIAWMRLPEPFQE